MEDTPVEIQEELGPGEQIHWSGTEHKPLKSLYRLFDRTFVTIIGGVLTAFILSRLIDGVLQVIGLTLGLLIVHKLWRSLSTYFLRHEYYIVADNSVIKYSDGVLFDNVVQLKINDITHVDAGIKALLANTPDDENPTQPNEPGRSGGNSLPLEFVGTGFRFLFYNLSDCSDLYIRASNNHKSSNTSTEIKGKFVTDASTMVEHIESQQT